jgi:hypothetical protein
VARAARVCWGPYRVIAAISAGGRASTGRRRGSSRRAPPPPQGSCRHRTWLQAAGLAAAFDPVCCCWRLLHAAHTYEYRTARTVLHETS